MLIKKIMFLPNICNENECFHLIANNQVASTRFFHFIVQLFIKDVLGIDVNHPGLYEETSAYY